jgi:hypothetical protein
MPVITTRETHNGLQYVCGSQPKKLDTRKDLCVAIEKRVVIRAASCSGEVNTNPNPGLGYHLVESCVIEDGQSCWWIVHP